MNWEIEFLNLLKTLFAEAEKLIFSKVFYAIVDLAKLYLLQIT